MDLICLILIIAIGVITRSSYLLFKDYNDLNSKYSKIKYDNEKLLSEINKFKRKRDSKGKFIKN